MLLYPCYFLTGIKQITKSKSTISGLPLYCDKFGSTCYTEESDPGPANEPLESEFELSASVSEVGCIGRQTADPKYSLRLRN